MLMQTMAPEKEDCVVGGDEADDSSAAGDEGDEGKKDAHDPMLRLGGDGGLEETLSSRTGSRGGKARPAWRGTTPA